MLSNFSIVLPATVPAGWVITATATDSTNNTSEFSDWVNVVSVPALQASAKSSNRQFSLSWATNGGSYILQQTFSLNPAVWSTVTNSPGQTNGFWILPLPSTNSQSFYRLAVP